LDTFQVLEDGVAQPVSAMAKEDAPISIGLLFDASASMAGKLERSRAAISQLLGTSVAGDEYFLLEFNDSPKILSGFTSDQGEIVRALGYIQPQGWTSLFDAVHLALNQMKKARNSRRALVVLSDGGDNNSRYSLGEIKSLLRESDVAMYAIGMLGPMVTPGSIRCLRNLTNETGGRMFPVASLSQLPDVIDKVSVALREQYILAYSPTNPARDGRFRRVTVKLLPRIGLPRLHASWRVGYYAPQ